MPKRKSQTSKPKLNVATNKKEQLTVSQIETDAITEVILDRKLVEIARKTEKRETFSFVYIFTAFTEILVARSVSKGSVALRCSGGREGLQSGDIWRRLAPDYDPRIQPVFGEFSLAEFQRKIIFSAFDVHRVSAQ